jgi:valyl-tRNA synthetase
MPQVHLHTLGTISVAEANAMYAHALATGRNVHYGQFIMNFSHMRTHSKNNFRCASCSREAIHAKVVTTNDTHANLRFFLSNDSHDILTEDHIVPVYFGGLKNNHTNIQSLCNSCNTTKGNRVAGCWSIMTKQQKTLAIQKTLVRVRKRLSNKDYLTKAPREKVDHDAKSFALLQDYLLKVQEPDPKVIDACNHLSEAV